MGSTFNIKEVSIMQTTLRHWEYYDMTEKFSELYIKSKNGESFDELYDIIISRENILLAYRSIKTNKGSQTPGTDKFTIGKFKGLEQDEFIQLIRDKLTNYQPKKVKRVMIPKSNGDMRPLGIPTILDRIIQQMFKQVLEPIAEAKFYKHSYGFRPLRSASHAKARLDTLLNRGFHYTVDIDVKGFFDNVNHTLLNKQLWNIGIRDKRVLKIISKMLKSPIENEGIPTKGTPQGGILSPLLANIVLNDLDQWIAGQWEDFQTQKEYSTFRERYRAQGRTNLKKGFLIRYADDFKILCKDSETAWKWFYAVKDFLKNRLKLDISNEKSKVINLRKRHTEFLGFKIKAIKKGTKYVAKSNVRDKKIKEIQSKLKSRIKSIQAKPSSLTVKDFNATVLGIHNYFKYATHGYKDFNKLSFSLSRAMYNRLKNVAAYGYPNNANTTYKNYYGHVRRKTFSIGNSHMYPIVGVRHQSNMNFTQTLTPYTDEGRKLIAKKLDGILEAEIIKLMKADVKDRSTEYMDNRISRYSMKKGKCEVTKQFIAATETHCHHYLPIDLGGDDSFGNLRIVHVFVHRLVHAINKETIDKYLKLLNLNHKQIGTINNYRRVCKLELI